MIELNWWILPVFSVLFNPVEIIGLQVRAPCYSTVSKPSGGFHECLGSFFFQTRLYYGCSSINDIWQCSIDNDDNFVAREMANCSRECVDDLISPCSTTQTIGDHGVQFHGSPCEFPFHYHGRDYYSCTTAGHSELWCTIHKTQSTSKGINWSWGPCGTECFADKQYSCRTTDDKVCQFPFVYQNQTFNECSYVGHDNPWCPIVVNEYGHATEHWGNCRAECPVSSKTATTRKLDVKQEMEINRELSIKGHGNGWLIGFVVVGIILILSILGNVFLGLKVKDRGSLHHDWVHFSKKIEERPNILEENDDII